VKIYQVLGQMLLYLIITVEYQYPLSTFRIESLCTVWLMMLKLIHSFAA